jgi:hypothetical protein
LKRSIALIKTNKAINFALNSRSISSYIEKIVLTAIKCGERERKLNAFFFYEQGRELNAK